MGGFNRNTFLAVAIAAITVAVVSGKLLEPKPFKRLIPADTLRDFPGMCFASTQCKVYHPNDTWSLAPFCGKSTCRAMKNPDATIKLLEVVLAEEVLDCGPLIDLEKTPDCTLVEDDAEGAYGEEGAEAKEFPECCPKYDCKDDAKITYVGSQEEPGVPTIEGGEGVGKKEKDEKEKDSKKKE